MEYELDENGNPILDDEGNKKRIKYPSLTQGLVPKDRDMTVSKEDTDSAFDEALGQSNRNVLKRNLDKATSKKDKTAEDGVTEDVMGRIDKAGKADDLIDNKYTDAIEKLNKELAAEELALSTGLKEARGDASIGNLIALGIQAAGQMYAASKGIDIKLNTSAITDNQATELKRLQEEVDNNRRVLRARIQEGRKLLKEERVRDTKKKEDRERQDKLDKTAEIKMEQYNQAVKEAHPKALALHKKKIATKVDSFQKEWNRTKPKARADFINRMMGEGNELEPAVMDKVLGINSWYESNDDPDIKIIKQMISNKVKLMIGAPPAAKAERDIEGRPVVSSTTSSERDDSTSQNPHGEPAPVGTKEGPKNISGEKQAQVFKRIYNDPNTSEAKKAAIWQSFKMYKDRDTSWLSEK